MSLNLASLLSNSARLRHPDAARHPFTTTSRLCYGERRGGASLGLPGELLAGGIQPGEKVRLDGAQCAGLHDRLFRRAATRAESSFRSSTLLVANEVAFQLEDSEARAFVVHRQCAAVAWEALERVPGCRLVYTVEDGRGTKGRADSKRFEDVTSSRPHRPISHRRPATTPPSSFTRAVRRANRKGPS